MNNASRHILFLATEYDAPGMRPYARNIINAMWQEGDHVLIVTRDGVDNQAFPKIPAAAITWIDYPTNKVAKAIFRFRPSSVHCEIERIIDSHNISLVYSLTGELVLAPIIKRLQRRLPMLYTVHDAVYHPYKFSSLGKWLKDRLIIAWPQQHLFKHTPCKVTNSHEQVQHIKRTYPYHKVYYAPFPTLVNDDIAQGSKHVDELKDIPDGYILFFGTLHLYKGVHLLYESYLSHPELQTHQLVIAGTGDLYFDCEQDVKNVTIINRFVDDDELRDLFTRAAVVVYPYTSATQSGVTSIASYFGKPMVLSDLPFFRQTCENSEGVEFFPNGDTQALAAAIERSLQSSATTHDLYQREYAPHALHAALDDIITRTLGNNLLH